MTISQNKVKKQSWEYKSIQHATKENVTYHAIKDYQTYRTAGKYSL